VHIVFDPVRDGSCTLGDCSKGKVSADGYGRVDTEEQSQQGSHQ
jgi:hypothetical protein